VREEVVLLRQISETALMGGYPYPITIVIDNAAAHLYVPGHWT